MIPMTCPGPCSRRRAPRPAAAGCRGMTLIELMVALAIGLFLTWGAIAVYLQSKDNYRTAETMARLQENSRFALETLEPDLRLAGFWGRHNDPVRVILPAGGLDVTCAGTDVSGWALDVRVPVAATDDDYDLDCAAHGSARAGSDLLIVRRASERRTAPQAGQIQVHGDLSLASLFDDGIVPAGFGPDAETRDLVVHAYYVDDESSFSAAIPSLRRKTLVMGNVLEDQEMITGVENLQVQFGIDTDADGSVERYVDPDHPAVAGSRIIAVRLWMLIRSEEAPDASFQDTRIYQPPDADADPITPGDASYPDRFQRLEVTRTIYLRNAGSS